MFTLIRLRFKNRSLESVNTKCVSPASKKREPFGPLPISNSSQNYLTFPAFQLANSVS
jgi:hypothetical protein